MMTLLKLNFKAALIYFFTLFVLYPISETVCSLFSHLFRSALQKINDFTDKIKRVAPSSILQQ